MTASPSIILGNRKGYHGSHVVTPYIEALTTVEQRAALRKFARYQPEEPITWRRAGRGLFWVTLKRASLEDELLSMARRRERGIQQSIATLARWTGASADLVSRVLRSMAKRGLGTLSVSRGRYGKATFRLVGFQSRSHKRYKAAGLNAEAPKGRDPMAIYSEDERAKIEADAYAWRVGLSRSLEAMGFTGPDAESDYLAYMAAM